MNYQNITEEIIKKETLKNKIPTLLIHSCCAPCSTYVLEYLSQYFKITILYYNPNIYPSEEYQKRAEEQEMLIKKMNLKNEVSLVITPYDSNEYFEKIKGLENDIEGGSRCYKCYQLRMEKSAKYAKENNQKYLNKVVPVLIEGESEKKGKFFGYTDTMKLVNVKCDPSCVGKIINVKIKEIKTWSLDGDINND